ncbi:MAG: toll/interleukin-1 receptor domain-containing protein [Clostridium butyricum]|nr:toll/interleukin-1 receptor domain-containing protein [Clostridium butyricum]
MESPKVFISYSWDNDLHKDWIVMLTNNLRKQGIDANFDRGVIQKGTINLNRMMIENLRDNDFIIVVMTKNYKERAEGYKGGVGLETMLLGNEILSDTQKVIPLKRD